MASSQCCENPPATDPACGQGQVVESLGGLKAYTAGSPGCKKAIILASDVFGYEAPNFRKIADKVASCGFYVIAPDFFYGDPLVPCDNLYEAFSTWKEKHTTDKAFEDAKSVIGALREKGVTAIGAAGYCWGAKVVVDLAKFDHIKAAVMLHPSLITVDDIKAVKCHISILGAEVDETSPPELLKQFEEVLSANSEVNSHVKIFPGVAHGWTVRYDTNDNIAVEKAEEACKDMVDWFVKYVN